MAAARIALVVVAALASLVPWRRTPPWVPVLAIAVAGCATTVVPWHLADRALRDLGAALAFLALAVPLAAGLDRIGYFEALAARVAVGRHLLVWMWLLAAATVVVFNLDAAVVLLTPLYVRIADRRGLDVVHAAAIPAILASLASSVLPVSNLTNLIAAARLHLGTGDFLRHLALPAVVAVAIGGLIHLRRAPTRPQRLVTSAPTPEANRPHAMVLGGGVTTFLLLGFTLGDRVGVPAWAVAGVALVVTTAADRHLPWRHLPVGAVAIAAGLGVLAGGAAPHLHVDRIVGIAGAPGTLATIGATTVAANAVNNLPAMLLTLPSLDAHPARVWAVLLGANLGPTLWITGALSSLLWQSSMRLLGHRVSARQYARWAAVAGAPALFAATAVHLLLR